ncbi:MAG: P-loop NTPase, partial [Bacilli bacterium]|nr:P-loop NTPase [Bacilli bacterium]
ELVSLIVEKAVKMAQMMNIPILALVENMAYLECPHCGEKIYPYGKGNEEEAKRLGIPYYASLPIDPKLAAAVDAGKIEDYEGEYLTELSERLHDL